MAEQSIEWREIQIQRAGSNYRIEERIQNDRTKILSFVLWIRKFFSRVVSLFLPVYPFIRLISDFSFFSLLSVIIFYQNHEWFGIAPNTYLYYADSRSSWETSLFLHCIHQIYRFALDSEHTHTAIHNTYEQRKKIMGF